MECTGQTCDQMCDARWCILKRIHSLNSGSGQQACNGGVQSQCDMRCHTVSNCKQYCNPQTCNMTCRGEECNQNCISEEQGCIMQCMGSSCTRTCDAYTCEMTRRGSSNSYTKQVFREWLVLSTYLGERKYGTLWNNLSGKRTVHVPQVFKSRLHDFEQIECHCGCLGISGSNYFNPYFNRIR